MPTPLPDKKFFKIGEVAALVGVKAHVLRYWESELGVLRPLKTRGLHRMYRREDVEILSEVRKLLHEDGLTLAAAKRRFAKVRTRVLANELAERPLASQASSASLAEGAVSSPVLGAVAQAPVQGAVAQAPARAGLQNGESARALGLRAELLQLRNDLTALLTQLDAPAKPEPTSSIATATVTAVVPKTVLMQRAADLRRPR